MEQKNIPNVDNKDWEKEFYNLLFSENLDNISVRKAGELKNKHFPHSLFRYRSPNEHTLELLETDLIRLSRADEFNDPYDGDVLFDFGKIDENNQNKVVDRFFELTDLNLSSEEKERIKNSNTPYLDVLKLVYENDDSVNKSGSLNEFQSAMTKTLTHFLKEIFSNLNVNAKKIKLLACFSETNLINPMWAHYAQNHEGICIEYDLKNKFKYHGWLDKDSNYSGGISLVNACEPVFYVEHSDQTETLIQMHDNKKINILKLNNEPFLKKSADWSYEKEWRISINSDPFLWDGIKKINSNYFTKLPKPKAVYLGLNVKKKFKTKIKKICENRGISLFKMEKDSSRYNLKPKILFEFPVGQLNDCNHIAECIEKEFLKDLIYYHFSNNLTLGSMLDSSNLILKSFENVSKDKIISFLDKILFKYDYFPVLNDYYHSVLLFLIQLYKNDNYKKIPTSDGKTIEENIIEWIELSFSGSFKIPIMRYLINFEGLLRRFYARFALLDDKHREIYENKLSDFYIINGNFISYVYPPCTPEFKVPNEEFFKKYGDKTPFKNPDSYIHPFCDPYLLELIDKYILNNLNLILKEYYICNNFLENECYNEFLKLKKIVYELEQLTKNEYDNIRKENNRWWRMDLDQKMELKHDVISDSLCWILEGYDNILSLLTDDIKEILKILAGIRISSDYYLNDKNSSDNAHMSFWAEKCCDKLKLSYDEKVVSSNWIKNVYFYPKNNPLDLLKKL